MSGADITSAGGTWWSYRRTGNVGIWEIDDWAKLFEEELQDAERHYSETANKPEITATLVVFDTVESLNSEMQEHITDAWSQLAQAVDVERTGYVADSISAMAIRANVDAPETELDWFESLEEARSWAED